MKVEDFDYELPPEAVAQEPLPERDQARLLVVPRAGGELAHRRVRDLPELLCPGDVLIFNDTRVLPVRLYARRPTGGQVELLLLERVGEGRWSCLAQPGRRLGTGSWLVFPDGRQARLLARAGPFWTLQWTREPEDWPAWLAQHGRMPLPPYIHRTRDDSRWRLDRERYQTVFASRPGAVAAPTAGLHFTRELLERIEARGVRCAFLTLHVGAGTFLPVRAWRVEEHRMHGEAFEIPPQTAEAVARARAAGGIVVAVGTTVVRALETQAEPGRRIRPGAGRTECFIYPGYEFRVVDALVTNFHLPRSTLLMLVCALAGRERILEAYREALRLGYRFYSYGDAMFVTPLRERQ